MGKGRLEIFSDGVLAIIITIMVLEMKTPRDAELSALRPLAPVFLSYVLSFLYLGIYWGNHHHLLSAVHRVTGGIIWANLHLLFWLTLVPFVTRWMGEYRFARWPTMLYGVILWLAGFAYLILQRAILQEEGAGSRLAAVVGRDWKGKISLLIFGIAILLSLRLPLVAATLYGVGVLLWLIPDRRIERILNTPAETERDQRTA
jgi:uncharacterized membrane protein